MNKVFSEHRQAHHLGLVYGHFDVAETVFKHTA